MAAFGSFECSERVLTNTGRHSEWTSTWLRKRALENRQEICKTLEGCLKLNSPNLSTMRRNRPEHREVVEFESQADRGLLPEAQAPIPPERVLAFRRSQQVPEPVIASSCNTPERHTCKLSSAPRRYRRARPTGKFCRPLRDPVFGWRLHISECLPALHSERPPKRPRRQWKRELQELRNWPSSLKAF